MTGQLIATLNTGSSSIKLAVYRPETGTRPGETLLRANLSGLPDTPRLSVRSEDQALANRFSAAADITDLSPARIAPALLTAIEAAFAAPVDALGHRVVQGGPDILEARRATPALLDYLDTLSPLAADHQPHNLSAVRALAKVRPDLVQTLSFDTAFHRNQPRLAQLYALPRALTASGIIRYGYHGLSYAHIARNLADLFAGRAHRRTLALHLGSGASLCALLDGRSLASSMGFSAISGIPMSTRSGDIDPGAILYLITHRDMSPEAVSHMLRKDSGLLGVSGLSGDLRAVEASQSPEAAEAIALFIYRIVRECGSLIAAMGGLDALVFTGGIGENSSQVRAGIAAGLAWAGVRIDPYANETGMPDIAASGSPVGALILPADEEQEIARGCLSVLQAGQAQDSPNIPSS